MVADHNGAQDLAFHVLSFSVNNKSNGVGRGRKVGRPLKCYIYSVVQQVAVRVGPIRCDSSPVAASSARAHPAPCAGTRRINDSPRRRRRRRRRMR